VISRGFKLATAGYRMDVVLLVVLLSYRLTVCRLGSSRKSTPLWSIETEKGFKV
jgi:hypothetical protein